jgi:hypothetical protein
VLVGAGPDGSLVHPPAVVGLGPRLLPWARQIALRFGRPVWLVGSALELPDPRDVDVRVLLNDEEFLARYGDPAEWHKGLWFPNRKDGSLRYAADMWDLSREASLVLGLNIDFQVQPPIESGKYPVAKRHRLDDVAEIRCIEEP